MLVIWYCALPLRFPLLLDAWLDLPGSHPPSLMRRNINAIPPNRSLMLSELKIARQKDMRRPCVCTTSGWYSLVGNAQKKSSEKTQPSKHVRAAGMP